MKPRTKLQHQVVELSSRLLEITESQKQWAYKVCLEHKGYAIKSRVLCLDCGITFSPELVKRKTAVCPQCQTKIKVEQTRKTTDQQTTYFAIAEVFGEFQLVRNYELIAYYKKDRPVRYFLHEILQNWILPDGKTTLFGLQHTLNGYADSWNGNMEIRKESYNYYSGNKYNVYTDKYHPDSYFKPEYSKFGINHELSGLTFLDAIQYIPKNPKLETLIKAKQYALLSKGQSWQINSFWPSIKICLRNKYKVKDASIWMDYLDLLRYFKKDLLNSKYVCPSNLKVAHDRLMKKKRKILRLQELDRERQRVIERQQKLDKAIVEYVERNKKFFELEFTNGNISITVLKSIDEFKEEGDELKHCVYTNEYYLKENSLILSAKVDGKRTETIEVKLPQLRIEQSRGISNKVTPYNEKIVALVRKNLKKIKAIIKQSTSEDEKAPVKQSA